MFTYTEEDLREIIPTLQKTVQGTQQWTQRLAPQITAAARWFNKHICPEDILPIEAENNARHAVAWRAYAQAIPSLDIVATPTGFAVTSTDTLTPASRQRVDAAIAQATLEAETAACDIIALMQRDTRWRALPSSQKYINLFPDPLEFSQLSTGTTRPAVGSRHAATAPRPELRAKPESSAAPLTYYLSRIPEIETAQRILADYVLSTPVLDALIKAATPGVTNDAATFQILERTRHHLLLLIDTDIQRQIIIRDARDTTRHTVATHPESPISALWEKSPIAHTDTTYENKKESSGYFF